MALSAAIVLVLDLKGRSFLDLPTACRKANNPDRDCGSQSSSSRSYSIILIEDVRVRVRARVY